VEHLVRIRITVYKTFNAKDIFGEAMPKVPAGYQNTCPRLKEGQTFISQDAGFPEGFCSWAYADIQRDLTMLRFGCNFPGMPNDVVYSCCTDGLRPVIFKSERLPD
jgi:uncharacterized repeat protein (TIGR04076 family)